MRLVFETLELDGFKSFSNKKHLLDFGLLPDGLIFMSGRNEVEPRLGSNGAGKSTVWDCLTWVLFGSTPNGLKNTDVRPWDGTKTVRGALTITVDGKEHVIERRANPNKLTLDDEPAGPEAITNLIQMNMDLFTQAILMAQQRPLFLDQMPSEKMKLFSDVLELERWEQRSQQAASKLKELKKVQSEIENEIASTEGALDEIDSSMKDVKKRSADWEEDRRTRRERNEKEAAEALKRKETLEKQYGDADLAYDSAKLALKDYEEIKAEAEEVFDKALRAHDVAQLEIRSKERQVKDLRRDISSLGEGDDCPTCGQTLKGTSLGKHKAEVEKQIKTLQKEIDAGVPKDLTEPLDAAQKRVSEIKAKMADLKSAAESAGDARDTLYPRLVEARTDSARYQDAANELEDEENPFNAQLMKLRKRKGELTKDERELNKELKATLRDIEHFSFWVKGFRDIRLYIIDEVLEDLEVASNAMLEEMGLIGWKMLFESERETQSGTISRGINVTILSPHNKDPVKWQAWSGGEGQRLRLVGSLALAEVLLNHAGIDSTLEILDEPTRHLSAEGIRDIHEFLSDRALRLKKQIFYVDHAAISSRHFSSTITVVKDKSGSHLEY